MGKKKQKNKTQPIARPSPVRHKSIFNYRDYKAKHAGKLLFASALLFCLLLFSIFKNISYPLFWADESMTAIGTERVLQFGYPKVHDGKNVFYDLRHSDPNLGINEKDDAYVGGTSWGHYYYGVIGYKLAKLSDDIYTKTGIYRATYAIAGVIGLLLLGVMISRMYTDAFSRYAFLSLYLVFSLMSVSLALLIREVRYYALVFLFTSVILGLYTTHRFYRPVNRIYFIIIMSILLWLLYITFAPVFFIMVASIGLAELIVSINQIRKSGLKSAIQYVLPVILPLFISLAAVYPFLSYFKTFEISRALKEFNNFDSAKYWLNVQTVFYYFKTFELLWLALGLKVLMIFHARKIVTQRTPQFLTSCFLTLYFIVFLFVIAKIPNVTYTRYIIYLQPILSIIIIIDFFILLTQYSINSAKLFPVKMMIPVALFAGLFIYTLIGNMKYIKGHVYEMGHRYEGPLDYTIPYIKEHYPEPEKLVIATNYEETSYMYYLKSKVIIGYTGNNLQEDSVIEPDIISYRKTWGNYGDIFNGFLKKNQYETVKFPILDSSVNTIPELNFRPPFIHHFMTLLPVNDSEATILYLRSQMR